MKRIFIISMLFTVILSLHCFGQKKLDYYPVNIPLKQLLKIPSEESEASLVFPIDIKITGISRDKKWYKVHIFYDLVFFGRFNYDGWVKADVFELIKGVTPETIVY